MTPSSVDQLASINSQIVQYLEVLLALGGVLAFAYFALRVGLPRAFGVKSNGSQAIEILSRCSLEPKSTLYLIKTGSQVSLIATSENGVAFLTAIAPENVEELVSAQRDTKPSTDYAALLPWRRKAERNR